MLNETITSTAASSTTVATKTVNMLEKTYDKTLEKAEDMGIPKWGTISILIGTKFCNKV